MRIKCLASQRLDLTTGSERLIRGDPNWTEEEIQAYLDDCERRDKEEDTKAHARIEEEIRAAGGFGKSRKGMKEQLNETSTERAAEVAYNQAHYRFVC
jgi:hypothetical protein